MPNEATTAKSFASVLGPIALFIDDDPFSLGAVRATLIDLGFNLVVTAEHGIQAIGIFDGMQPKPDLVVCDIQMPVMDGIEVAAALGARMYAGDVVLMSGGDSSMLEMAAMLAAQASKLRIIGVLQKPITRESLASALGSAT